MPRIILSLRVVFRTNTLKNHVQGVTVHLGINLIEFSRTCIWISLHRIQVPAPLLSMLTCQFHCFLVGFALQSWTSLIASLISICNYISWICTAETAEGNLCSFSEPCIGFPSKQAGEVSPKTIMNYWQNRYLLCNLLLMEHLGVLCCVARAAATSGVHN